MLSVWSAEPRLSTTAALAGGTSSSDLMSSAGQFGASACAGSAGGSACGKAMTAVVIPYASEASSTTAAITLSNRTRDLSASGDGGPASVPVRRP